jgi:hypothetical protein
MRLPSRGCAFGGIRAPAVAASPASNRGSTATSKVDTKGVLALRLERVLPTAFFRSSVRRSALSSQQKWMQREAWLLWR